MEIDRKNPIDQAPNVQCDAVSWIMHEFGDNKYC